MITLSILDKPGLSEAQKTVTLYHYLHQPVSSKCSVESYGVHLNGLGLVGYLIFGRPQAQRCRDWYGDVADVQNGKCEVTRWQVLNLARVWLSPSVQAGGEHCNPDHVPGFFDRKGVWRSTLASQVLEKTIQQIGFDYLMRRPPCFLNEPYEISWLLSYCNTNLHRGVIYARAGFELYSTNKNNIQTWRIRIPPLTPEQDRMVREASRVSPRSIRFRAERAQMNFL